VDFIINVGSNIFVSNAKKLKKKLKLNRPLVTSQILKNYLRPLNHQASMPFEVV
jgi:hypothetical protein